MSDTNLPSRAEKILGMARAARNFPNAAARIRAAKGLVHECYRTAINDLGAKPVPIGEHEIFESAYGDPSGRQYWTDWLASELSPQVLADLLAAHCSRSEDAYRQNVQTLVSKLAGAQYESVREAIDAVILDPETRHLIPHSLINALGEGQPDGMHETNKGGRPPTADWETIEDLVRTECTTRGCVPHDKDGPKGWQTQADVGRFVAKLLEDRNEKAEISTVKSHVREILTKLKAERQKPGF